MHKSIRALSALLVLLIASLACSSLGNSPDENSPAATSENSSPAQTVAAINAKRTEVAATDEAFNLLSTALMETLEAAPPTPDLAATRQAEDDAATAAVAEGMQLRLEEIQEDGYLDQISGEYYRLDDFNENWAQINWYQWWGTGYDPQDFVIRADAEWESASQSANFFTSGCGFVFREDGAENHYLVYLGMDGNAYFNRIYNGNWKTIGYTYYRHLNIPKDSGELLLVVQGSRVTFYVNGELVESWRDEVLTEGNLALTLLSGINTGFGTRCNMENIELWVLDP